MTLDNREWILPTHLLAQMGRFGGGCGDEKAQSRRRRGYGHKSLSRPGPPVAGLTNSLPVRMGIRGCVWHGEAAELEEAVLRPQGADVEGVVLRWRGEVRKELRKCL